MNFPASMLAILGGPAAISGPLSPYPSISEKEIDAVVEVMRSGHLSGFFGSWDEGFYGGPRIREFEHAWCERFGAKHSVSVNSNTSGLHAAMGAIGISPGDEVIIPATTMSATAMAPLIYGGIPVFADIEGDTFCVDPESVKANMTGKTRAVIAVNLFGHPARLHELRALCDARGIYLIEDNAQAVLASEQGKQCGTIGHIGVFSLNYHKHIHTGEGGMCTAENDRLAERLRMIRNHAESVVGPAGVNDLVNMVGFNLRMTELSAAVGLAQLTDIGRHLGLRRQLGTALSAGISDIEGIQTPVVRAGCEHSYYTWMAKYDERSMGVSRATFVEALQSEGVPCFSGYVRPLYMLPIFQKRVAIGRDGFPFNLSDRRYEPGQCPTAERLFEKEFIGIECCAWKIDDELPAMFIDAFRKVCEARSDLAAYEQHRSRRKAAE
jgi:perosamine synthetase